MLKYVVLVHKLAFCLVKDCLAVMQQGTEFIKLRANVKQFRRKFTLDTDLAHIRWTPTNKKPHKARSMLSETVCLSDYSISKTEKCQAFFALVKLSFVTVAIDTIKEIRVGRNTELLRARENCMSDMPVSCLFFTSFVFYTFFF